MMHIIKKKYIATEMNVGIADYIIKYDSITKDGVERKIGRRLNHQALHVHDYDTLLQKVKTAWETGHWPTTLRRPLPFEDIWVEIQ